MISNVFHFCYGLSEDFGGKPYSLVHYLAVKSAYEVNSPEEIFFYYTYEPSGDWWEKTKPLVTLIKVEAPEEIFGNKLYHVAHKADILRLQKLYEIGGIYMDLDTISRKSFKPLLNNKFVIGKQGKFRNMGLCNAVIMSEKKSKFVKLWLESYKSFRSKGKDKYWAEHSVKLPLLIAKKNSNLLHIEPYDSFHYPLYYPTSLKKMFEKVKEYPNAYCHHLWEGGSWNKYLKDLTEEKIFNNDTTYNLIARKFLMNY
ncbi:MAG: glycosyltransferase [Ignavibacteria bacterium]